MAADTLSIAHQIAEMERLYPAFTTRWKTNKVIWRGPLQPSGHTIYTVKIQYALAQSPKVWVSDPPLSKEFLASQTAHVYPGGRLCLFYPHTREWLPAMLIAQTTIPWTSEWLFYYEDWLIVGEWRGRGIDHTTGKMADYKLRHAFRR